MKAGFIVITVVLQCITLSAGTILAQVLIQGKIHLMNILQKNCVIETAFLVIIRQKKMQIN